MAAAADVAGPTVTRTPGPPAPIQRKPYNFQHLMELDEFVRQKKLATFKKEKKDIKKLYGSYDKALKKNDYATAKGVLDSLRDKYGRMNAKKVAGSGAKGKDYWRSDQSRQTFMTRLTSDLTQEEAWLQNKADSALFDAHVEAYQKSRYYHMTKQQNVQSILQTGLDPKFGGSDKGLSDAIDSEDYKKNSAGNVHVANYWVSHSMESTLTDKGFTPEYLRAFVGAEHPMSNDTDMMGYAMYAWKTFMKIDPDAIYSANTAFTALTPQKQRAIASKIREHYPSPQPEIDDVVRIHIKCLAQQLLFSDHPLADPGTRRRYSM